MSAPVPFTIDVWSDVMCPWCVVGIRQLERALAVLEGEVAATVRLHPFELNPDMPPEGEEQGAHIQRKYGRSPAQTGEVRETLRKAGEAAGYDFAYTGTGDAPPAMMWNTRAAHKLLAHALRDVGAEAQMRLKHALFDAHFQQRRNVSDPQVLVDIAEQAGLDRTGALAALADPELDALVTAGERQAWDANITGVPAMVVNGKFLIPGAQDAAVYADVLRKVVERERT